MREREGKASDGSVPLLFPGSRLMPFRLAQSRASRCMSLTSGGHTHIARSSGAASQAEGFDCQDSKISVSVCNGFLSSGFGLAGHDRLDSSPLLLPFERPNNGTSLILVVDVPWKGAARIIQSLKKARLQKPVRAVPTVIHQGATTCACKCGAWHLPPSSPC